MFCQNVLQALPTLKWSSTTAEKAPFTVSACFMHVGTAAHFNRRPMWDVLNNTYHDKCLGRTGSVAWPPTFTRPQSIIRIFTYGGTQNPSVFSCNRKWRHTAPTHFWPVKQFVTALRLSKECDRPWPNVSMRTLINVNILNICFELWLHKKIKNSIFIKLSLILFFLMDVRLGPNVKGTT